MGRKRNKGKSRKASNKMPKSQAPSSDNNNVSQADLTNRLRNLSLQDSNDLTVVQSQADLTRRLNNLSIQLDINCDHGHLPPSRGGATNVGENEEQLELHETVVRAQFSKNGLDRNSCL